LCRSNVEVENFLKLASEVLNFEKSDQLKAEGLTLGERTQRYLALGVVGSKNKKHGDLLHKASLSLQHGLENPPQLCGEPRLDDLGKLPEMVERARQGSKTAEKYLQAKELLAQAIIALRVGDHLSSFHLFRKSWRLWDLIQIPQHICRQALKAAQDDFDSNPTNANALFSILIFEPMTKRGCDHRELVEMAKICVSLDPKVADYHRILGCLYGFAGDFENGRRSIERALDLEVEPGWLYDKATMLRLTETEKPEVVIKAYQDYIEANEKDERKIPEAYYSLGFTHLFCMKNEREARECRKKARKAERPPVRLPCFGPVEDDFPPKLLLDTYFKTKETMGDHNILEAFAGLQVQATAKSDRGMPCKKAARDKHGKEDCTACASCGNVGAQSWCGRCKKVWYCDRQCQKQHWKEHKKTCD
jgi:tetratricopeptide (TPR) repeat protein